MPRSPLPIRAPEVQVRYFDSFQRIFANAQVSLEQIYFSLNLLVDVAQIRTFEDMYRTFDDHVSYLLPFFDCNLIIVMYKGWFLILGSFQII